VPFISISDIWAVVSVFSNCCDLTVLMKMPDENTPRKAIIAKKRKTENGMFIK